MVAPATPEAAGQTKTDSPEPHDAPGPAISSATVTAAPEGPSISTQALAPETDDPSLPLTGGIGALAAAMVLGGLELRRAGQLRARPLGRRIAHPAPETQRYEVALGRRERPDQVLLLERALRQIGRHCHTTGTPLPGLDRVLVTEDHLEFRWSGLASPPPAPFHGSSRSWLISQDEAGSLPTDPHPVAYPALVTLGVSDHGEWVMIDLEQAELVGLRGDPEARLSSLSAMLVELGSAPWSDELSLTVVGGEPAFAESAPSGLVRVCASVEEGVRRVEQLARRRTAAYRTEGAQTAHSRVDPDRAESVAAQIFLFCDAIDADQHLRLAAALEGKGIAMAAVVGTEDPSLAHWAIRNPDAPMLSSRTGAVEVRAATIPRHTREAIVALVDSLDETSHTSAPWWRDADELPNVRTLMPRRALEDTQPVQIIDLAERVAPHPQLLLIGPIELAGTAGEPPARARRQCEEYCGWLLENPGRTATAMSRELMVADGTRRSNMSRLRSWLGNAPDGSTYLPEAYSGRISLHPGISSDWQQLQILTGPGINHLSTASLAAVLDSVRGAPLADAAPGQWHWAEELRTDMVSLIRDAGVLLAEQARSNGDLDLARWAATRALIVAPRR
ncbi:MAG: hypothetical protein IPL43_11820 [Micropruina sp.]|nr:hypothetical protein [Micropruina sp.]